MNTAIAQLVKTGESLIDVDDFDALMALVTNLEFSAPDLNANDLVTAGAAVRRWQAKSVIRRDYFRAQLLEQASRNAGIRSYAVSASIATTHF